MTIRVGTILPSFTIRDLDGQEHRWKPDVTSPLLLIALLKTSCGACKTAFPVLERLAQRYHPQLLVWGMSQSTASRTRAFAQQAACTFPFALDIEFNVSRRIDPIGVPTLLLFSQSGMCRFYHEGFSRDQFEALTAIIAGLLGHSTVLPLFTLEDTAPPFRPACESSHRLILEEAT